MVDATVGEGFAYYLSLGIDAVCPTAPVVWCGEGAKVSHCPITVEECPTSVVHCHLSTVIYAVCCTSTQDSHRPILVEDCPASVVPHHLPAGIYAVCVTRTQVSHHPITVEESMPRPLLISADPTTCPFAFMPDAALSSRRAYPSQSSSHYCKGGGGFPWRLLPARWH